MFIAQMLLCSSIAAKCIGVEDETGLVSNVAACEKRIEEMVSDAREIMPLFVVGSTRSKGNIFVRFGPAVPLCSPRGSRACDP